MHYTDKVQLLPPPENLYHSNRDVLLFGKRQSHLFKSNRLYQRLLRSIRHAKTHILRFHLKRTGVFFETSSFMQGCAIGRRVNPPEP